MLRVIARPMVRIAERWIPESLVLAIILTFVVALMSLGLTNSGPLDIVNAWGEGLAGLLEFIAQIAITLVLGYTLAHTTPVERFLRRISALPRSPAAAYGFVTLIAALASLISWGLGLIVGGVMAVEVARSARERGIRLHYPLLVAGAYSGFVVWHMGYTGSGPLAAATPGSFFEGLAPLVPVTQTIFAWWNIVAAIVVIVATVLSMMLLTPRSDDPIVELEADTESDARESAYDETTTQPATLPAADSPRPAEDSTPHEGVRTPAARINEARALTLALGTALIAYLVMYFVREGLALTLDTVNWSFLALVFLLVRSPRQLAALITDAGRTVGQLLLQYPLYAGILGMITTTGLVEVLSSFFVSVSTTQTLTTMTLISAGLLNIFVPSGGGQFAIQAPIFIDAADRLGVEHDVVIMAIAYGDQWTNMIQPFFALPLLAIAGLGIRDILGYTTVTLLVTGVIFIGTLLMLGSG